MVKCFLKDPYKPLSKKGKKILTKERESVNGLLIYKR